jgi:hypothetical protein
MTFTEYAKSCGIELLRDDIKYLRAVTARMPTEARRDVLREYASIWVGEMKKCNHDAQRQNKGRRAANLWIRDAYSEI